jgi:hypothetical protein
MIKKRAGGNWNSGQSGALLAEYTTLGYYTGFDHHEIHEQGQPLLLLDVGHQVP